MSQVPPPANGSGHGEWICQPLKYAHTIMCNREVLPCMTFAARTTLPPNACALPGDRGKRQESASARHSGEYVKRDPGFIWRTGSG